MKNLTPHLNDWRVEIDDEDLGWLIFDKQDSRVNVLTKAAMAELGQAMDQIEALAKDGSIKALGMLSAKQGSFIFGADVNEFKDLTVESEIGPMIAEAHALFQRVEDLPVHTAVGIHGLCLGGGLELALAFKTIIGVKDDKTKVGFPEVQLGIFPGFGGTARSIKRAGGQAALTAMLTGKHFRASAAKAMGLIDKTINDPLGLRWAVRKELLKPSKPRKPGLMARATTWPIARGIVAGMAEKQVAKKANPDHYPAPYTILEHFKKNGGSEKALYAGEVELFPKLMVSDTSKNLRRIFHLQDRMKKQSGAKFKAQRVHVVGAGLMGGDIAAYCALQGLEVSLQDLDMDRIQPALKRAKKLFDKKVRGGSQAKKAAMARLIPDVEGNHIARADVIIEAVVERLDIKKTVFADLEAKAKPDAVLATNTSALPLEDIAEGLKDPSRLVGLHFFNPVPQMPLVEVVYGTNSAQGEVDRAVAFCGQIKKSPLKVKSAKGFLVNRALLPYMVKALEVMQAGTPKEEIDSALLKFGMPMGPVELADQVGLDVGLYVAQTLDLGTGAGAEVLQSMIDQGKLGMKSGEGFYKWEKRKPVRDLSPYKDQDQSALAEEIIKPMIDECQRIVDEGVVEDADMADIGMIFGTGFAPFKGGPLNYEASKSAA